nr:benzyl alcohol O-benzoyltransferase [Tanacetum cinerariifolium]
MGNKNPASVIREALAKVLVFYYPLAGRLKEGLGRKLMVDCTGEGVLFIEAEADVNLKQFREIFHPPFPYLKKLLCYVPGSDSIVGSPLILIQVTHLLCGGFIFSARVNHTMFDGHGMVQFLTALGEMAQGVTCIWRCRTIALQPNPEDDMHLMFFVDARTKMNPHVCVGYYGNCGVIPCVISKARDLSNKTLDHALKLVMKAKSIVSE